MSLTERDKKIKKVAFEMVAKFGLDMTILGLINDQKAIEASLIRVFNKAIDKVLFTVLYGVGGINLVTSSEDASIETRDDGAEFIAQQYQAESKFLDQIKSKLEENDFEVDVLEENEGLTTIRVSYKLTAPQS